MKKTNEHIESPALGCKVGQAYQIMLGQLSKALRENGLDITPGEYLVLRAIYSHEGLQQCEIAEMVGKDKAAVCRCIAGLEKRGLVSTTSVSHKCLRVFLTKDSIEMRPLIMKVAAERHKELMSLITPDKLEIFTEIIDKIITSK